MDYGLLGQRIRQERLRLNLTQEKLAEEISITTAYLGQIERGERSLKLDKLISIASALGVTVDYLLHDYIIPDEDILIDELHQLFHHRSAEDKEFAINIVKMVFSYLDTQDNP